MASTPQKSFRKPTGRIRVATYGLSLAALAAAVAASRPLNSMSGDSYPFVLIYAAIAFASWIGGYRAAILVAVLGWIAAYFFLEPAGTLGLGQTRSVFEILAYLVTSATIVGIGEAVRVAQLRGHKTEETAWRQTETLCNTLAGIGDGAIAIDHQGRISFLNDVAADLTGWTLQEATGKPLGDVFRIFNGQTGLPVEKTVERVLVEGDVAELANHNWLTAKDGTKRPIDGSAAPIRDANGHTIGVLVVFRDIAERRSAEKSLRESEERFRSLADAAPMLIWMSGPDKEGIYFNHTWLEFTGKPAEVQLGEGWLELVYPEDRQSLRDICAEGFRHQKSFTTEFRLRRADGQYRWLLDAGTPRFDSSGSFLGFVGSCVDITDRKRFEDAQRESEQRLRLALEAGRMGTWEWRIPANEVIWSSSLEAIHGLKPGTFAGTFEAYQQDIHADDREKVRDSITRALENGGEHYIEYRIIWPDGSLHWVEGRGKLFRNEAGAPVRMTGICADITDRKQAEEALRESEDRFRTLADNISQFAWMADAQGWIFWYNQRWYDYTGTTLEEMQGWGWRKVHHPDHVDRVVERIQRSWDTGEAWEDTFPLRGKDGKYRWFLSRALPIHDDRDHVIRWFGTNTDVTEQRTAEEALKEADRRKDAFLATLAHELRNPLAPIHNGLQILKLEGHDHATFEEVRAMMERQVDQMVRLVDDLLDVSRITRDKLELRKDRVELASVVYQAIETCRPLLEDSDHEFTLSLPPEPLYLHADPVRLAQVFGNLINNACKYTEPPGHVWLTAERQGSEVVVSVKDNGIGIVPDKLPKVFDMFTQVDRSLERSQSGLGIGLTLVKRLVQMHGGSIQALSDGPGRGSAFVVGLPILCASPQAVAPDTTISATPTGRRFLVVDDSREAAASLAMLLKMTGHVTQTAHDGVEAVETANRFRPDVVLLDIGLPRMNGYEVCRRIRQQPWGQRIVMVAITGWGQDEDRRRSQEVGFDGHLVKPVDHEALETLLAVLQPCA